jgi:hypothetical protein
MLVYMAAGLSIAVSGVPASLAQDPDVVDPCKSAGMTTIEPKEPQAQGPVSNAVISIDVPIGRVCAGPESVDGEPVFVRRTTEGQGMTVVEVSTTPFEGVLASNPTGLLGRPDQPAGW